MTLARDANRITVIGGTSSSDGTTVTPIYVDPTTHRLLVDLAGSGITVGTTTITSGTSGRILYDNAGVVGELATTGSGNVVLATSPTLVSPTLGAALATTLNKVTITSPATGSTLTIDDGFTLHANGNATVSGTNTGDQNLFSSIPVSGQTTVTANSTTTALTLVAGTNVTITTDNTAKSVTINSSGGGTPGGADTQVQVNNSGSFAGYAGFTFDKTSLLGLGANGGGLGKIQFFGNTSGSVTLQPNAAAGTGIVLTMPATTGTVVTTGDTGTVSNTMLAGSIANAKLVSSSITIAGSATSLGGSITLDTITGVASNGYLKRTGANTLTNVSSIPNGDLANSSITLNAGTSVGLTTPGAMSLGSTYTIGATTDKLQFGALGLNVATPANAGQISSVLAANNITGLLIKRATDTLPTGDFLIFQNALAGTLFDIDITGTIKTGVWNGTAIGVPYGGTGVATLTAHGVLIGEGTGNVAATAAGSAGQILQSGGASADPSYSTPTYPSASGTSGKVLISDGTNNVYSTPTFPNASATSGKVIKSDGTNWIASTETYAAPGTSGNVMTSDGTNWTSAAPASSSTPKMKWATIFEGSLNARLGVANNINTGICSIALGGLKIDTGVSVASGGYVDVLLNTNTTFRAYEAGGIFTCSLQTNTGGTAIYDSFCGIGSPTIAGTGITFTPNHMGFKLLGNNTNVTLYGTVGNGSTETTVSLFSGVNSNDTLDLIMVINSGSVDFYYRQNGSSLSTKQTISTGLPSQGASENNLRFALTNKNAGNEIVVVYGYASFER